MQIIDSLLLRMDPFLIFPFRLTDISLLGFYFGTFLLALNCVLLGRISIRGILHINHSYYGKLEKETVRMHNLSVKAIQVKDKESYRACNKEANEAFGKYFFSQIATGAALLWPLPFALHWMHSRFADVSFPLPFVGFSLSYSALFILFYIMARIIFSKISVYLPPIVKAAPQSDENKEEMIQWSDIGRKKGTPDQPDSPGGEHLESMDKNHYIPLAG